MYTGDTTKSPEAVSSVESLEEKSSPRVTTDEYILVEHGRSLVVRNGQRITGPPPDWTGPAPAKGSEVFIGRLPHDAMEEELLPFLEKAGVVFQLRLMIDQPAANRGFGFVTYADPGSAQRAVRELDQTLLRPRKRIAVVLSIDNRRLFLGGLPSSVSAQDILEEVSTCVKNVTGVILYPCPADRARNRGFAFVEFSDHMFAAIARKELQQNDRNRMFKRFNDHGYKIQVDWATPEPQVDAEQMANVTNLFVRNVSLSVSEAELANLFSLDGQLNVTRVRRPSNYAFVHFALREHAERAKTRLNGVEVDGLSLEIEWAKPPPRGDCAAFEHRYRSQPGRSGKKRRDPTLYSSMSLGPIPAVNVSMRVGVHHRGTSVEAVIRQPHQWQQQQRHPGQLAYPTMPRPTPTNNLSTTPSPALSEAEYVNKVAIELFGMPPEYKALTWPTGDGRKLYYSSITLAGQTEVISALYSDRESALRAAVSHCFFRIQTTQQFLASHVRSITATLPIIADVGGLYQQPGPIPLLPQVPTTTSLSSTSAESAASGLQASSPMDHTFPSVMPLGGPKPALLS